MLKKDKNYYIAVKDLNYLSKLDLTDVLHAVGEKVLFAALDNVPWDTGTLARNLDYKVEGDHVEIGSLRDNFLDYSVYQELGTGIYADGGIGRGGPNNPDKTKGVPWVYQDSNGEWHTTYGVKPQHYLKDALEDNKQAIVEMIKEEIERQIKNA